MQKAKQVVHDFLSGDGKHKTTIDQDTRGAITEEQVQPERHENITTAVDRDVHQEHHQTRIQPVVAKEVLPEKHTQNVLPVQQKTVRHGNEQDTRRTLEQDVSRFKSTSTTRDTTHTTNANPTMTGERIHHHVHEHIQPVIQKETVAPEVVHTIAPVHETHHAAPVHHETTTLPPKTLEEFTRGNTTMEGAGSQTVREYEGCPQPFKEAPDAQERIHGGSGLRGEKMAGGMTAGHVHGSKHRSKLGRKDSSSSLSSSDEEGVKMNRSAGVTGHGHAGNTGHTVAGGLGQTPGASTTAPRKASLKDKLNPRKDADGDGKAGFMD